MPKIRAFFDKMSEARKAAQMLKSMGFNDAHLDMMDRYNNDEEYSEETNPAGTEKAINLSALVLNSKGYTNSIRKAPLLSAQPMVSGMGLYEEIYDISAQLLVSAEEGKIDEVKKSVMEAGGSFK